MMTERCAASRAVRALLIALLCQSAAAQDAGPAAGAKGVLDTGGVTLGRMGEPAAVDASKVQFSEAETRLWMSDHLRNVAHPARLYYQFTKSGSLEDGFSDSVYLDILKVNADGTRDANLHFFSGEREQPFSPDNVTNIRGNPILGVYLQGDVMDMDRLTQGSWRYFQRLIKLALSGSATVEPATVTFDGKTLPARRIQITPYLHDAGRSRYEQFEGKRYEFLMSDDIPGTLYQIHTVVPGPSDKDQPLIEETLTFKKVEYRG